MSERDSAGAPSVQEVMLRDPLEPVTRKERLYLLAVSSVGLFVEYTGLVPTKISALGIEFPKTNQNALLYVLALIILYFLAAFVIYAVARRREPVSATRERIVSPLPGRGREKARP